MWDNNWSAAAKALRAPSAARSRVEGSGARMVWSKNRLAACIGCPRSWLAVAMKRGLRVPLLSHRCQREGELAGRLFALAPFGE